MRFGRLADMSGFGRLVGRTALITGASRGIGAAVARAFAAEGAAVAIGHQPTEMMARLAGELAEELSSTGASVITVPGDLADPLGPAAMVTTVRDRLGPLDILVANAAASAATKWNEITVEEWDYINAVNTRGTWLLAQAAYEDLKANAGSIITLTSVMVETGQPGKLHYTASKAAILGMTRALARDLGPDGIRINAVMPGAIRTENEVELSPDADAASTRLLPKQSIPRRGYADDLAGAFVFLASAEASFITGQVINVDGGWVMY